MTVAWILLVASSTLGWTAIAAAGDLRARPGFWAAAHAALWLLMLAAWVLARRRPVPLAVTVGAAVLFRLIAVAAPPSLSDDVYRYVWDGRVQRHGIHPYLHAPADPALAGLRDADWARINHPDVRTIYPPLAQAWFLLLAALGAGPTGFKLAAGLADVGVVLALARLLRLLDLPHDRLILYAWNPLAVIETAGSGHLEPLGLAILVLALGAIIAARSSLSTLLLAAAVQIKLLPLVLVPGFVRRGGARAAIVFAVALVGLALPYALTGPAVGPGLADYAERWEHNALVYAGAERGVAWLAGLVHLPATPRSVARGAMLVALAVVVAWVVARGGLDAAREAFVVLCATVVLSPTVHPWYALWPLPLAAAFLSWGWLAFAALLPWTYLTGAGDVPWGVRWAVWGPALVLLARDAHAAWRARRGPRGRMRG